MLIGARDPDRHPPAGARQARLGVCARVRDLRARHRRRRVRARDRERRDRHHHRRRHREPPSLPACARRAPASSNTSTSPGPTPSSAGATSTTSASRWACSSRARRRPTPTSSCPIPDSGVPAAIGFAQESGMPFELGIIRNHYVGRTFIEPEQRIRAARRQAQALGQRQRRSAATASC